MNRGEEYKKRSGAIERNQRKLKGIERNLKKLNEKQEICCHPGGFTVFYLL